MSCASAMLAIAGKLPTSGLQEWMRLHSYHLGTQPKTAALYSARLCLTPIPITPCMFPELPLPCHSSCPGPDPFQSWLWQIIPHWILWSSEIKSASLFLLNTLFGYKTSIWQWMCNTVFIPLKSSESYAKGLIQAGLLMYWSHRKTSFSLI